MSSRQLARATRSALLLTVLAFGLILALGLAACGAESDAATPEQPTLTSQAIPATVSATATTNECDVTAWTVRFEVSGGFMGTQRSLDLDSDGQAVATDVRKGTRAASQLPEDRLDRVSTMLRGLCPFKPASRPAACADCFEYGLTIQWGSQNGRFQATDITVAEQGLEPLIGELSALLVEILGD